MNVESTMNNLAGLLRRLSAGVCRRAGCAGGTHHCGSYAYVTRNGWLLDVCLPSNFQGTRSPFAAIPLPWTGTGEELQAEVEKWCNEMEPA